MKALVGALGGYLREHPEELLRLAKNATRLRVGVPLAALRWFLDQALRSGSVEQLEIDSEPPGLRIAGSFVLLGTPIRAGAVVRAEEIRLGPGELRMKLYFTDVRLKVLDPSVETPVSALIRSGALDLTKAGDLAAYMPRRPAFVVEAKDDFVVVDLAKHPKFATKRTRQLLAVVAPLVAIRSIETDWDHLDVAFGAFPVGVGPAWGLFRRSL